MTAALAVAALALAVWSGMDAVGAAARRPDADHESVAELRIDLGAPANIDRVAWWAGASAQPLPERFWIDLSLDGREWFTVAGTDFGVYVADESGIQAVFAPVAARYVRLLVESGTPGAAVPGELEAFETGAPAQVRIDNFEYIPRTVLVPKGATVVWINEDGPPHTVTAGRPSDDPWARPFDSAGLAQGRYDMMMQGDRWSFTFQQAGEFEYFCLPHTFMTARVLVVEL